MSIHKPIRVPSPASGTRNDGHAAAEPGTGAFQQDLLGLLAIGQIDWSASFLVQAVASGPMLELVTRHMGPYACLVPLTNRKRRQVWFAALAGMPAPRADMPRDALLSRLLLKSNRELLESVYGSVPPGFEQALDRLGEQARDPNLYLDLFGILQESNRASLIKEFQHLRDADVGLIPLLPQMRGASKIAAAFSSADALLRFLSVYTYITGSPPSDQVWKEISSGSKPYSVLERAYRARPFSHTAVIDHPDFEFINSLQALEAAGLRFQNCLGSKAAYAIQNSHQYYVWRGWLTPAVVCVQNDAIGWSFAEAKLAKNESLPAKMKIALHQKLNLFGIRTWGKRDVLEHAYDDLDILEDEDNPAE